MTSMTACPYCYQRFSLGKLWFQCTGRPAPGKERCKKKVDEERQRMTGYATASWPVFPPTSRLRENTAACPDCGNPSRIRACPYCRTPLPAGFADGHSPLIGMVGGKSAGKTVYTTVLVHELRNNVRSRFGADISFAGEQAGVDTRQWLERYERALFNDSTLFESTASSADGLRIPLVLQWRQPRRRLGIGTHTSTTLSFYDAAGEDMTSQEFVNSQGYLSAADGLIVLLDPFQLPGTRDRIAVPPTRDSEPPLNVLWRITELLRNSVGSRRRIPVPLAVVFSKIDAFFDLFEDGHPLLREPTPGPYYDETEGQDTDEHLRALLADLGADDIDAHLTTNYKTFRYFAVSSLGAQPDYEHKRVATGGVRPYRVDEPLLWLLHRFKIIDQRGGL